MNQREFHSTRPSSPQTNVEMTSIYDIQTEFSGDLAAKLIAGTDDVANIKDAHKLALEHLRDAYQSALKHLKEIKDGEGDDPWSTRLPMPAGALQSTAMLRCEQILTLDTKGATFSAWLGGSSTRFDDQSFNRAELHRWINVLELPSKYRFNEKIVPAQGSGQGNLVGSDQTDPSILCTRQELIAAFGSLTGMDISWFKNLNDSPRLKAARKYAGRGGHGLTLEPMFCPFEVMQWLVSEKRKKGRPLSVDTGWRLLESNFLKVYNINSIGDSRKEQAT